MGSKQRTIMQAFYTASTRIILMHYKKDNRMSTEAKFNCVVLFEDEVRMAAKTVARFASMGSDPDSEAYQAAARAVFHTCFVALQGADEEGAVLLLGRKPDGFDG